MTPMTRRKEMLAFSRPSLGDEEIAEILHSMRSGWITTGPRTKQLEKDFGNAAYATIRSFVLKFEKLGLLKSTQYGNRVKYAVRVC